MGEVWWKSTLAKLNSTSIPSRFALSHSAKKQDCRGYSPARDAQSDEMSNKARARELRGGSSSGGGRVWPEGKGEALLPGSPPPLLRAGILGALRGAREMFWILRTSAAFETRKRSG